MRVDGGPTWLAVAAVPGPMKEASRMDAVVHAVDLALNLDAFLADAAGRVGNWLYALLFGAVFCETGLAFTSFLPGDSLLFAAGTLAGAGILHPVPLGAVLLAAAVLGDAANWLAGRCLGRRLLQGRLKRRGSATTSASSSWPPSPCRWRRWWSAHWSPGPSGVRTRR